MSDQTNTFSNFLPIPEAGAGVSFDAASVAILAAFAGTGGIWGPCIQAEPNPDGGVDLFSTDGSAMCWVQDKSGRMMKAPKIRFSIPDGFVENCAERDGPMVCTEEGYQFPAPLPKWMQPGRVSLYCMGPQGNDGVPGALLLVQGQEEAPKAEGDLGIFSASSVFNDKVIRSGELRIIAGEGMNAVDINFRGVIGKLGCANASGSSFNPDYLSKLGELPGLAKVELLAPSGAMLVSCTLRLNENVIRVAIMPMTPEDNSFRPAEATA